MTNPRTPPNISLIRADLPDPRTETVPPAPGVKPKPLHQPKRSRPQHRQLDRHPRSRDRGQLIKPPNGQPAQPLSAAHRPHPTPRQPANHPATTQPPNPRPPHHPTKPTPGRRFNSPNSYLRADGLAIRVCSLFRICANWGVGRYDASAPTNPASRANQVRQKGRARLDAVTRGTVTPVRKEPKGAKCGT